MPKLEPLEHQGDVRWADMFKGYLGDTGEMIPKLRELGYQVDTAHSLVHTGREYEDAVPILTTWLTKAKNRGYKEDIVRSLSVPWAHAAVPVLFHELDTAGPDPHEEGKGVGGYRWATGNALDVLYDDANYEDYKRRVEDKKYGISRGPLLEGLARTKTHQEEVAQIALNWLAEGDPFLLSCAFDTIKRLKYVAAKDVVQRYLDHQNSSIRGFAKSAYKVLENAEKRQKSST